MGWGRRYGRPKKTIPLVQCSAVVRVGDRSGPSCTRLKTTARAGGGDAPPPRPVALDGDNMKAIACPLCAQLDRDERLLSEAIEAFRRSHSAPS